MATADPTLLLGIPGWVLATYWQPIETRPTELYKEVKPSWLPNWLFGAVWSVLYGLISASIILYWWRAEDKPLYTATMILLLVNLVLNKAWSPIFFYPTKRPFVAAVLASIALVVLVATLATAVIALVFMVLNAQWLPFALILPYPVWLFVAMVLNVIFLVRYADEARKYNKTEMEAKII